MIGIDGATHSATINTAIREKDSASAKMTLATANGPAPTSKQSANRPQEDQVVLSEQSRELSQILQNNLAVERTDPNKEAKSPGKMPEQKALSVIEVVKYFPPYLNSARRQEILQNYPLLRKQIDQMTVPPPPDFLIEAQNPSLPIQDTTVTAENQR